MQITDTSDVWWKTAVVYCLDVETFYDLDGNGVGDLAGLSSRIDYLAELGITCLWLMPFYPTAERDDGYDITDFYGVDPRLGTHGDLVELIRTAKDRGLRVIVDLVVNHTSIKHPWFQQARRSKDNPYRDYYVWRDTEPPDTSAKVVFPDAELKVYLTADPEVRAQRRSKEVSDLDYETVAADLARRDALDQGREVSPLAEAHDAFLLDTTGMTVEEIVDTLAGKLGHGRIDG